MSHDTRRNQVKSLNTAFNDTRTVNTLNFQLESLNFKKHAYFVDEQILQLKY